MQHRRHSNSSAKLSLIDLHKLTTVKCSTRRLNLIRYSKIGVNLKTEQNVTVTSSVFEVKQPDDDDC